MKTHVGVNAESGLVHTVQYTVTCLLTVGYVLETCQECSADRHAVRALYDSVFQKLMVVQGVFK